MSLYAISYGNVAAYLCIPSLITVSNFWGRRVDAEPTTCYRTSEVVDEYDNPTPRLDYGPSASRRLLRALIQPTGSREPIAPGRQAVTATWRLFSTAPIAAHERVVWQGRRFEVTGEPAVWSPRFGHTHYEAILTHVEG